MGYVYCVIAGLIIGFPAGLLVCRKLKTSSANPTVDPTPSGVIKTLIESEVAKGVDVHEAKKKTIKFVEDINKYLEEGNP